MRVYEVVKLMDKSLSLYLLDENNYILALDNKYKDWDVVKISIVKPYLSSSYYPEFYYNYTYDYCKPPARSAIALTIKEPEDLSDRESGIIPQWPI